tara:strand:- start:655 stop:924 length:270 start_codon:yes stop_codon:yes gene_type:complete
MNKQEKKVFKQLVRDHQSDDLLAQKQRFADKIRTRAKSGHIVILRHGWDCDGETVYAETRLPAIPTVVQRYIDSDQEWADGFASYTIIG